MTAAEALLAVILTPEQLATWRELFPSLPYGAEIYWRGSTIFVGCPGAVGTTVIDSTGDLAYEMRGDE